MQIIIKNTEATLYLTDYVIKKRVNKVYLSNKINKTLIRLRTRRELAYLEKVRSLVPVPTVFKSDELSIWESKIPGVPLYNDIYYVPLITSYLAKLHNNKIIHGDLTPENILLTYTDVYFIDWSFAKKVVKDIDLARDFYTLYKHLKNHNFELEYLNTFEIEYAEKVNYPYMQYKIILQKMRNYV